MASFMERMGLAPEEDEHEANVKVLKALGLSPEPDDHPATAPKDPYNLGSPEERFATPAKPPRTMLQGVHEAIDPSTVLPAVVANYGRNVREQAGAGTEMAGQGLTDIVQGRSATGFGRVGMGTLGTLISPVTGGVKTAVQDPLTQITGNPEFGERASLMFPVNVGGPALRTAAHNIHPTTRAADFIAGKVGSENMPEVLARLRSNPRLRPIDVNDQLRMAGQGLVAGESPAASRTLTESMRASAAGARDAVKGTYNEAMGAPPNLYDQYTKLQNQAQTIGKTKIQPLLDAAKPVDTSSVVADMDKVIKPGLQAVVPGEPKFQSRLQAELQEWKSELTNPDGSVLTDPGKLHAVQSDMRRRAEELSMHPETRRLGRQLYDYREKLKDSIEASAPGYKEGLSKYKDQKDIEDAFTFGRDVLKNTDDLKTDPSYLAQWVKHKDRTPEELESARLGARQAIEKKMGSIKQSGLDPARSGTDVPQVEFNRQKIETLFGKENTDKMFKHLQDERDIALTNNRGLANSKTAETQSAAQELKPRDVSLPHSNLPGWALALGAGTGALSGNPTLGAIAGGSLAAARGAKSGYDWLARRGEISRNNSIADLITRNDPQTMALLSIAAQRVGQRNKLSNLLAPP